LSATVECLVCDLSLDFCAIKVRELGRILNVPVGFLKRHPFPGPGLAVRVLGDVTQGNALEVLRQASALKSQTGCIIFLVVPLPIYQTHLYFPIFSG